MRPLTLAMLPALLLSGCNGTGEAVGASNGTAAPAAQAQSGRPFAVTQVAKFEQPWAMAFLPHGYALVTEKPGRLRLWQIASNSVNTVAGVPPVDHGGQGGWAT